VPDKISGFKPIEPLAPVKGAEKAQGEAPGAAATVAQSADHVTLTDSARALQKFEEAVAKAPVVNVAKVDSVKQALKSGTYKIDAGRVTDKILNFERELK
jgi:negative regulator of flagellin synthesis FlgM